MEAGKLIEKGKVVNKNISPLLFITEDTIAFMNLHNRYKRYGWEPLYDKGEIPNIVIEAFDCIENTIKAHEMNVLKTHEANEKNKVDNPSSKPRKKLPKN